MLKTLYQKTIELAHHKHASHILFWVTFVESSVLPVPPEIMYIPMALAHPKKSYWYAFIATMGTTFGGFLGYLIGYAFFETIGVWVIDLYGLEEAFKSFASLYNEWGLWIVVSAGLSPFPYKVITITSGFTDMNFLVFAVASLISRACRFYLLAYLIKKFGARVQKHIEENMNFYSIIFLVAVILIAILVKYVL